MLAITMLSIFAVTLRLILENDTEDVEQYKNDPWFEE